MKNTFYITTPIYYVNDQPHIGHAYTTIVADVLARFWREQLGEDKVYFLTGTDEHGAKVAEAAAKKKLSSQKFSDQVAQQFKKTWLNLDIANNDFIRTTEERHKKIVIEILNTLKDKGVLYEDDYQGLYCVGCEKFITEAELVNGKCPDHNQAPTLIKENNWFFKLNTFLPKIKKLIEQDKLIIYPTSRKNEVLGLIKQNIPDFSISRSKKSVSWGIDLPWDKEQKVYVWVDALSNYITALGYPQGKLYQKFWPANIQLMGLDILKFHALYWPAILLALDLPLPQKLCIHGHFTIDGQKMSKSLGNTIDPNDLVTKYGVDVTKYLLLSQFSFGSESDVNIQDWPVKYNADLVNGLGNLVSRVTNMIEQYLAGQIDIAKFKAIPLGHEETKQLRFKEALMTIWQVIKQCNTTIDQVKPWELFKQGKTKEVKQNLQALTKDLYSIAVALKPFMPQTSDQIIKILTTKKIVKPTEPLFPRLK